MTLTMFLEKIDSKVNQSKQFILDEIQEITDDYYAFEEYYAEWWIEQNEDWLNQEEFDENEFNEMRSECIEKYFFDKVNELHISNATIRYMVGKLSEEMRKQITFSCKLSGKSYNNEVMYQYFTNCVFKK